MIRFVYTVNYIGNGAPTVPERVAVVSFSIAAELHSNDITRVREIELVEVQCGEV